jgi:hypothetical protein
MADNPLTSAREIERLAKETLNVCKTDGFDTAQLWEAMHKQPRRSMPAVIDALLGDTKISGDITSPSFQLIKKDNIPTGIKIYGGSLANCDKERTIEYDLAPWQRPF